MFCAAGSVREMSREIAVTDWFNAQIAYNEQLPNAIAMALAAAAGSDSGSGLNVKTLHSIIAAYSVRIIPTVETIKMVGESEYFGFTPTLIRATNPNGPPTAQCYDSDESVPECALSLMVCRERPIRFHRLLSKSHQLQHHTLGAEIVPSPVRGDSVKGFVVSTAIQAVVCDPRDSRRLYLSDGLGIDRIDFNTQTQSTFDASGGGSDPKVSCAVSVLDLRRKDGAIDFQSIFAMTITSAGDALIVTDQQQHTIQTVYPATGQFVPFLTHPVADAIDIRCPMYLCLSRNRKHRKDSVLYVVCSKGVVEITTSSNSRTFKSIAISLLPRLPVVVSDGSGLILQCVFFRSAYRYVGMMLVHEMNPSRCGGMDCTRTGMLVLTNSYERTVTVVDPRSQRAVVMAGELGRAVDSDGIRDGPALAGARFSALRGVVCGGGSGGDNTGSAADGGGLSSDRFIYLADERSIRRLSLPYDDDMFTMFN